MPMDFLEGKVKKPVIKKEAAPDVAMHTPAKEKKTIVAPEIKKEEPKPLVTSVPVQENIEEVNLVNSFRAHLFKKRLTFSGLFVIIMVLITGLYYYFFARVPQQPIINANIKIKQNLNLAVPNVNVEVNANLNIENINLNANLNLEPVILPAINEEPPSPPIVLPPVVLPATELAPLRGSLVKFAQEAVVYLIENNGELRAIEPATVIFQNGQSLNKLSPTLIYVLSSRYQETRKGKDVKGQVDFDPRILTAAELKPFE